jgi:hypothetical protein
MSDLKWFSVNYNYKKNPKDFDPPEKEILKCPVPSQGLVSPGIIWCVVKWPDGVISAPEKRKPEKIEIIKRTVSK